MKNRKTRPSLGLSAPPKAVDPVLGALFATSTGPLASSKADGLLSDAEQAPAEAASVLEAVVGVDHHVRDKSDRKRKRKQHDEDDDLESKYLDRLADDDDDDDDEDDHHHHHTHVGASSGKRHKGGPSVPAPARADADGEESDDDDIDVPVHEALTTDRAAVELEKAGRTVFLNNVSSAAITSHKAKKTLLAHLSAVLDTAAAAAGPPQVVESLRFRSTAFSTAAIPKRGAFAKGELMDATTRSTNAYAVYTTAAAARLAVARLNGTVVLDRHLRADSVAHPAPMASRRCVFVGNLGFVDDESMVGAETGAAAATEKPKRNKKVAMDVEEGLWRVFGEHAGKVESVRVVRDPVTRVGKGFAYVQFDDINAVESALLLDGKEFPPMLPRPLRVARCIAPHKTTRALEAKKSKATTTDASDRGGRKRHDSRRASGAGANIYVPKPTAESKTLAGRADRLLGRGGATLFGKSKQDRKTATTTTTTTTTTTIAGGPAAEDMVFEGRRASAKDGKPKDLKFKGGGGGSGKRGRKANKFAKTGRGAVRAAKWKAQGGAT